jgi:hypothetical protein
MPLEGLHLDLRHLKLIFWYKILHTDEGDQIRPLDFFGTKIFIVNSKWDYKGKNLHLDCERLKRSTNLKFCRELHTINIGPRNFIQLNWSTGWAFISNFPGKVWNFPLSVIRLLTIFFRFQENISNNLKYNHRVFIGFYQFFMKFASEVTRSGHGWLKSISKVSKSHRLMHDGMNTTHFPKTDKHKKQDISILGKLDWI